MSELPVPGSQTPGKESRNTPGKPPSTPKHFPESLAKDGSFLNPFNHLLVPSQTGTPGPSNGKSPASVPQKDRTPSPKPASTKSGSEVFGWEATKITGSANPIPKPSQALFGSTSGKSSGDAPKTPSPQRPSGEVADTKPPNSGLFKSLPSTSTGNTPFAFGTAKSPLGDTNSPKPSVSPFGNTKSTTSLFATTPAQEFGSASAATANTTTFGGSGLSAEFGSASAATKNTPTFGGSGFRWNSSS